jgi:hypothetical protein
MAFVTLTATEVTEETYIYLRESQASLYPRPLDRSLQEASNWIATIRDWCQEWASIVRKSF